MKKLLPFAAIGAGLLLITRYLTGRKTAMENLQIIPIGIEIDSQKTNFAQLFYRVRLKLINNEAAPIIVKAIDLNVIYKGKNVAKIIRDDDFSVNARSEQILYINASISTLNVVSSIINLLTNRDNASLSFTFMGYIETDLGRVPVNFTKSVNA